MSFLRVAAFRKLWMGDVIARLGYQITQFLLPLLAVTVLHTSASQVGMVSASQFVPVIVLSLAAGVIADRVSTRALVVVCNLVRGAGLGLLGVSYALSGLSIWVLIGTAVLIGSATVFYDVGYQASIPKVISVQQLMSGNGILQASNSATQMAGPALAGFFVQAVGLSMGIAITTALFVGAVLNFWTLDLRGSEAVASKRPGLSIIAGLQYTWKSRPIRDLCVQSGLFNLHEQAFLTAFMVYGVRTVGMSGGTVGLVVGVGSLGALLGSLATGRLASRLHAGTTVSISLMVASLAILGACLLSVPLKPALAVVFAAAFFVNGFAQAAYNVFVVSLRQTIPPTEFLGAVTASYRLVSFGPMPLGALIGGTLVDAVGAGHAILVVAASVTVFSLYILASPIRRVRSVEEAPHTFRSRQPQEVSP